MAATGPTTNFKITDPDTLQVQDLGDRYISKDYLLEVHASIIPARKRPALFAWGVNTTGQLGLGDLVHRSSPTQVGSVTSWNLVYSGRSRVFQGIQTNGTLWTCGYGPLAQQGLGDLVHRSSPVQVGALTTWVKLGSLQTSTVGLTSAGTLWAWGSNGNGQLGLGDITTRSSPVQIGALTTWRQVVGSGGANNTAAIKLDGSLWVWGINTDGALGLGDRVHRSSPVQVGALLNWQDVAIGFNCTYALKTDGTIWAWGTNSIGRLGLGDLTHRSSPVQIGSDTNWKAIVSGANAVLALKQNGTLWSWGMNDEGQLGLGDQVHRSSPTQIGALSNWKEIYSGNGSAAAIKTDGTLWIWGRNSDGQLGLGDRVHRSSPTQVGSLTFWRRVAFGEASVYAISDGDI